MIEALKQLMATAVRKIASFIAATRTFKVEYGNIVQAVRAFPGEAGQMRTYVVRYLTGHLVYNSWTLRILEYVLSKIGLVVPPQKTTMVVVYFDEHDTGCLTHVIPHGSTLRQAVGSLDADILNAIHEAERIKKGYEERPDTWETLRDVPSPFSAPIHEFCDMRVGQLVSHYGGIMLSRFTGVVESIRLSGTDMIYTISTDDRGGLFASFESDEMTRAKHNFADSGMACDCTTHERLYRFDFIYRNPVMFDPKPPKANWIIPLAGSVEVCSRL